MSNVENVVYRYQPDGQPAVSYRGIPSGRTGGGGDLTAARASYRRDLTRLLHVDRHQLPPVIEHLEAVVHGMWVRTRIGAVHRDHSADRMFLQTLLAPGQSQEQLRAALARDAERGLDPVVVIVEPEDTVASVLEQMTPRDTVVVAYSDAEVEVGWAVIYGPEADGRQDIPRAPGWTELCDMPVWQFARRYGAASEEHAVRVDAMASPLAS